jgi:hypothetical protein
MIRILIRALTPLYVLAVIHAVPFLRPLTRPDELTEATCGFELTNVFCKLALPELGRTFRRTERPLAIFFWEATMVMEVGAFLTHIVTEALAPDWEVMRIEAVPAANPVTVPSDVTVAMAESELSKEAICVESEEEVTGIVTLSPTPIVYFVRLSDSVGCGDCVGADVGVAVGAGVEVWADASGFAVEVVGAGVEVVAAVCAAVSSETEFPKTLRHTLL